MENSNSTMDLESSENSILTSTRIEDGSSSMSLLRDNTLNEGFLIDSASLSLSAVNDSNNQTEAEDSNVVATADEEQNVNTRNEVGEPVSEEMAVEEEPEVEENLFEESEDFAAAATSPKQPQPEDADAADEEGDENEPEYPLPQFPLSRVKKIMGICINTEEEEEEDSVQKRNVIITKEAVYLMSLATEYFIGTIGEMAGRITVSSKKKTLQLPHLRQALSDSDAFAFLEGCFQPSIIIGD